MNMKEIDHILLTFIISLGSWIAAMCLIMAAILAIMTRQRKPPKPKCSCYFRERDNPYCPIHGVTRSSVLYKGRRVH